MTTDEIKKLPMQEKLQMMEALWDDLRERFERFEIPDEHKKLLALRRKRVESGEAELRDWDSVKGTIGQP